MLFGKRLVVKGSQVLLSVVWRYANEQSMADLGWLAGFDRKDSLRSEKRQSILRIAFVRSMKL